MPLFGCRHRKLSDVKEDGYQYCKRCNKAFEPVRAPCEHQWEVIDNAKRVRYQLGIEMEKGKLWVLQCKHCGNIKQINTGVDCGQDAGEAE